MTAAERASTGQGPPARLVQGWERALALLEEDLLRRDAAVRTRRAYGSDLRQFAGWAAAQGLAPDGAHATADPPLRGGPVRAGSRAGTAARKLAALRALFASQREHGLIAQNPADLVSTPRRPSRAAAGAQRHARPPACSTGSPPAGALELRDRAMFELAYSCGLRAEEIVSLAVGDVDHDAEQVRSRARAARPASCPPASPRWRPCAAYLERGTPGPARARRGTRHTRPGGPGRARAPPLRRCS